MEHGIEKEDQDLRVGNELEKDCPMCLQNIMRQMRMRLHLCFLLLGINYFSHHFTINSALTRPHAKYHLLLIAKDNQTDKEFINQVR